MPYRIIKYVVSIPLLEWRVAVASEVTDGAVLDVRSGLVRVAAGLAARVLHQPGLRDSPMTHMGFAARGG